MLVTFDLPNDYRITAEDWKIQLLKKSMTSLGMDDPGKTYEYEMVDGSKVTGTYVGFSGLNLKFRRKDGTEWEAPIIDMGDGSLVTEFLKAKGGKA